MEAPVSLEVVSAMECRIKSGTVVADVPPQAKGFTVQTPDTRVVDYGTHVPAIGASSLNPRRRASRTLLQRSGGAR